uniref:Variant surface glycoprotein 303 n=1 Tax=Trypanosoma brucei TaxID=5691 RepID=M4SXT2_9TRYP|nr:variant surface glycoprotein 303 [Trypanosoma brucei]
MRLPALLAILGSLFALIALRSQQAGENAAEFRDICALYRLLIQPIPNPTIIKGASGDDRKTARERQEEIQTLVRQLNLTVTPSAILKILAEDKPTEGWEKHKQIQSLKTHFCDKANFDALKQELTAYNHKDKAEYRQALNVPDDDTAKATLRPVIKQLAAKAADISKEIDEQATLILTKRKQARDYIVAALYGKAYAAKNKATDSSVEEPIPVPHKDTDVPWAADARDANCNPTTPIDKKAGYSIATDLLCLCCGGQLAATDQDKWCKAARITGVLAAPDAGTPATMATNMKKLIAECTAVGSDNEPPLEPGTVAAGVSKVFSHLGKNFIPTGNAAQKAAKPPKTNGFLGAYVVDGTNEAKCSADSDSLTTTASKGICIGYTSLREHKQGIIWVNSIASAARSLKQLAEAGTGQATHIAALKQVHQQMESTLMLGSILTHTANAAAKQSNKESNTNNNKCPQKAATADGCPTDDCIYNATSKECKPKSKSQTSATGDGEKAKEGAAATTECARHGNKAECDADKKDDKQNCAWRKGKDGETDEPDKEKCRSSSFLVNNKFALSVVSAAFMALFF